MSTNHDLKRNRAKDQKASYRRTKIAKEAKTRKSYDRGYISDREYKEECKRLGHKSWFQPGWNKGGKLKEEHKKKISESLKRSWMVRKSKGKNSMSKKHKEKLSKSLKEHWLDKKGIRKSTKAKNAIRDKAYKEFIYKAYVTNRTNLIAKRAKRGRTGLKIKSHEEWMKDPCKANHVGKINF